MREDRASRPVRTLGPTLARRLGPCGGVASPSAPPSAYRRLFCGVLLQVLFPGFVNLSSFSGDCSQKTFLEKSQGTNFFCVPGQQTGGCVGCYRTPAPGSLRKGQGEDQLTSESCCLSNLSLGSQGTLGSEDKGILAPLHHTCPPSELRHVLFSLPSAFLQNGPTGRGPHSFEGTSLRGSPSSVLVVGRETFG